MMSIIFFIMEEFLEEKLKYLYRGIKIGKLKITDKIGKYIKNKEISNLKILDIINHESGLINIWKDYKYGSSKKNLIQ